jgi:hypothetical protein
MEPLKDFKLERIIFRAARSVDWWGAEKGSLKSRRQRLRHK